MGPRKGMMKKKNKKAENEVPKNSTLPPLPPNSDWWVEFSQRLTGHLAPSDGPPTFESVFKLSMKTFDYVCSLIKEDMMVKPTGFTDLSGNVLSLNDRVAVALRRLIAGESLASVGESLGIHPSTVHRITWQFVEAMEEKAIHHLSWPLKKEEMEKIKSGFEKIQGFPNCCGAIDTTHVLFCQSLADPTSKVWCDKEKNQSMIVQAIVGPDMRFLDVVAGWPGSMTDSIVLETSTFFQHVKNGKRLNGKTVKLAKEIYLREYIVGDVSFPLLPWLLTPFHGRNLTESQANFNKRHLATRRVAGTALVRQKNTWGIIQGVMWRPNKHKLPRIILACCLLHNICIDLKDSVQDEGSASSCSSSQHDPDYGQQSCGSNESFASFHRERLGTYLFKKLPPL